jgi:hypothetical protein
MAAMGQSLDALEEIPTLSLEDFLRPTFMHHSAGTSYAPIAYTLHFIH